LSQSSDEAVAFDEIVDRISSMAAEVAAAESQVRLRRDGSFGVLPAEVATPLVMILNELLQNAVEHAYGPGQSGEVVLAVHRENGELRVTVADEGRGLPESFRIENSQRLGLQIVRTLATGEVRGTIELRPREGGGTVAELAVPV
ncbi:MAG TPA: ATP-binding protein, partial [Phytomonospora sp.]